MSQWWLRQWNDMKGNAKWAVVLALSGIIGAALKDALHSIFNIPTWAGWSILLILFIIVFVLVMRHMQPQVAQQQPIQPSDGALAQGIPTLSSLLGQNHQVSFDARQFFAQAYYSPVTAEIEKNIRTMAQQNAPSDHEGFYARFIGIGTAMYQYDLIWFVIYRSQLTALAELNARGNLPLAEVKKHYDKAVIDYSRTYAQYSFDQWMEYMQTHFLVIRFPSDMVDITHGGKDFLKYLAHWGRDASVKAN